MITGSGRIMQIYGLQGNAIMLRQVGNRISLAAAWIDGAFVKASWLSSGLMSRRANGLWAKCESGRKMRSEF